MGDVIQFKRPTLAEKHKGKSLCRDGFHKWKVDVAKKFDVKRGQLITVYVCERCGQRKVTAI